MQLRISQPFCYGYKYIRIKEAIAVKNRNEKERCEDRRANTDPHRLYLLLFIMPKRRAWALLKEGMSFYISSIIFLWKCRFKVNIVSCVLTVWMLKWARTFQIEFVKRILSIKINSIARKNIFIKENNLSSLFKFSWYYLRIERLQFYVFYSKI